ncbi:MAG: type II toxin-antitoxin system VapC family toxin [Deltaproteobacteria bacterium]|nr:type II toxin-antitoxin system VapC family toxin [Deltaproteobacteria bacterium]
MTPLVLLDTGTLSLLRRGHPQVSQRAAAYIVQHGRLTFTSLTWYEVIRGYRAIRAHRQLQVFQQFCQHCQILPLDDKALDTAATIYADLRQQGELIGEVDILIAGIAVTNGMGVVTHNTGHFRRVKGLYVEDWSQ